jgi:hypothetical protein
VEMRRFVTVPMPLVGQRFTTRLTMKKLPIGIQTFSEIINEDYLYIDKTGIASSLSDLKYFKKSWKYPYKVL